MKQLFFSFPLLKTKRFYLFLTLIMLFSALSGLLYTPEKIYNEPSFQEEKNAIEEALTAVEKRLAKCDDDFKPIYLQEKAFYEGALKFRLSPWSSYFAQEALSLRAELAVSGKDEKALQELERILTERDKEGLYEFCKKDPCLPDLDARLLFAENIPESAGRNAILYDIERLEESLSSGKDLFFASEENLSESDKALFQSLLKQKEQKLLHRSFNPVPANKQTLRTIERGVCCFLTILLLAVAGTGEKSILLFIVPLMGTVLLCSTVLFLTTLFFAPGTVEPEFLQWGGSLPFFPALFLRSLCRVLGSFPLILFVFNKSNPKIWKYVSFLPLLRFYLQSGAPYVPKLRFFVYLGDLAECIFPDLSAHAIRPFAPWMGICLWALFTILLLCKKNDGS